MNKQIKELHRRAVLWSDTPECPDTSEWHPDQIPEEYTKKIAELIIRECINTMAGEIVYNDNYKEKNKTISDMMELLKEHFGVEK